MCYTLKPYLEPLKITKQIKKEEKKRNGKIPKPSHMV
jgi:hypothetical protein